MKTWADRTMGGSKSSINRDMYNSKSNHQESRISQINSLPY